MSVCSNFCLNLPLMRSFPSSEWDLFQDLLVSCILSAYRWLSRVGLLTAEVRSNCEKLADQRPFKGQLAVRRVLSCAHAGVRHQVGFMAVRKKRRLLARCFQYKRLFLRRLSSGLSAAQSAEFESLRDHLVRRFGVDLSLRIVLRHIENIQSELRGVEEQARSHNISQWRQRMVASDADLSCWLKCRSTPVGVGVVDHEGNHCESDVGAAQAVFDFWDQFWSAARARQPPVPERVASLFSGLPRLPVQQWDPPSAQQLRLVALDGRGSHGPDGWVAREVAWLPLEIFGTFSLLGARWMKAGCVPAQFCESRMISIPKPGKVENHIIKVGHLRPITVLSVWWRIWTSSWCKTALRAWMRQHVPRQFAVAHCVSTGEVVVDLLGRLMGGGYLASLDYSEAYDLLDPCVTRELLLHLGWDPSLVEVVIPVWQDQQRWVSYGDHTHVRRTAPAPAAPQGDPLGPFIVALWTWAGWATVESVCSSASSVLQGLCWHSCLGYHGTFSCLVCLVRFCWFIGKSAKNCCGCVHSFTAYYS